MVLNTLHFMSLFLLVLIYPIVHSIRDFTTAQKPSPYALLKDLQGCHKGNTAKGLNHLKRYLEQFGYLKYQNETHLSDNVFDAPLASALITYQKNYHITPTGALDSTTVSKMTLPRCGDPDIINGVNTMLRTNNLHDPESKSSRTVAHYSFFPNYPRWPRYKTRLTYRFIPGTRADAILPVMRAFQMWASATHFRFSRVANNRRSDIVIGFASGNHGDGYPFDGPMGTIAHAFAPTDGRFHFDADEMWVNGAVLGGFDMESVALHEIGHLLGLGHSSVQSAIMYPIIEAERTKGLHQDDIMGIRVLYNVWY